MMKLRLKKKGLFTLIEMVVSLGVFSVLMLIMFQLFTSAQKAWMTSKSRTDAYENAKIALDLISRDLQCVFYIQNEVPFWHGAYADAAWGEFRNNDIIAFVSATPVPPSDTSSPLCEVKYQLAYVTDHSSANKPMDGWLMRSVTGDSAGVKWNFINNFKVGNYTIQDGATPAPTAAFTALEDFDPPDLLDFTNSSMKSQNVIPYVVELSFTCYDKAGNPLTKSTIPGTPTVTTFPYSVKISLTLMDKGAWDKWCALDNDPYNDTAPLVSTAQGTDESPEAWNFRQLNQKTFTKTVFIGERGQKY